jgi:hypothetical protein
MNRGRKTDGLSLLTAILINVIIFALAFVYITKIEPESMAVETASTVTPTDLEVSAVTVEEVLEILPPADFVNESVANVSENYDLPEFKNIFNSDFLPAGYRGSEYIVTVKLDIGANGVLNGEPEIVVSSGQEIVDDETITRLKKLKFTPAMNTSTGEAIGAVVTTRIFWLPYGGR